MQMPQSPPLPRIPRIRWFLIFLPDSCPFVVFDLIIMAKEKG